MRLGIVAGTILLLLTGAANAAGSPIDKSWTERAAVAFGGDVSLYGGGGPERWNGTPYTDSIYGGALRANLFLDPKWSVQFDFNTEHYHLTTTDYMNWNFATHISTRDASHLVGGFASIGHNGDYGDLESTVGLEALAFMGNLHLYAQAGWTRTIDDHSEYGNNTPYVHGEVRYFLTSNLMVAGNAGVGRVTEPGYSTTLYRWGGDIEAKLADTPWAGFISYQGSSEHWNDTTTHEVHSFLVGLRMQFGGPNTSLQAASQSGATLRDLNPWTGTNAVRQMY